MDKEAWQKKNREWAKQVQADKIALKARLEREYGMSNFIRRDELFEFAWEEGHPYGEAEIEAWYDRLAELVRPRPNDVLDAWKDGVYGKGASNGRTNDSTGG